MHVVAAVAPASHSGHGSKSPIGFLIVGIAFILIGGANLVNPSLSYRMNRWQYKNKEAWEPSNAALVAARIGGGVAVVVGIALLVVAATR